MNTDGTKQAERSLSDLKEIGDKIGMFFHLTFNNVQMLQITPIDLFDFETYLAKQESVGAILNPSFFAHERGFDKLEVVKQRLSVLRDVLRLKEARP